mmetsp:Transcript_36974/g.80958  ORF Transcript_36974/g.80958 Transcript_36974/m.80958 type:complete len:647 (-) Transcript_36974:5690-7630(-)
MPQNDPVKKDSLVKASPSVAESSSTLKAGGIVAPEVASHGDEPTPLGFIDKGGTLKSSSRNDDSTAGVASVASGGGGSSSRADDTITEARTNDTEIVSEQTSDEERISEQVSDGGSQNGRSEGGALPLPQAYAVDEGDIPLVMGTSVKDAEEEKKLRERKNRCVVLITLLALSLFIILLSIGLTRGFKKADTSTTEQGPSPSPTPQPLTHCPPEDPALIYALPSEVTDTFCSDNSNNITNTTANTTLRLGNGTSALCWDRIGPLLGGDRGSKFGVRVSLDGSGSRFAVSAIQEGSCDGNKLGVIRVYDIKNDFAFFPLGQKIEGIPGDQSVAELSGDGQRLVVGFPKRDGSVDNIGGFRVFEQENVTSRNWMLLGEPIVGTPGDKPLEDSYFGYTISTDRSGSVIAVGAPRARNDIGSVFVFRFAKKNGLWEQMGEEILGPGAIQGDRFGFSLSLSSDGKILAVGQQSDHGLEGRVVAYQYKEGTWEMLGQQIRGEAIGDKFGKFLSLSADGMTLVAGAKDHANAAGTGLVRIFGFNNTEDMWMRLGSTIESKALKYKPSRFHITADGSRIALATGKATIGQGYAEVYDYDGHDWQRVGGKIAAIEQTDKYGGDISISDDGSILLFSYSTDTKGAVQIYRLEERGT